MKVTDISLAVTRASGGLPGLSQSALAKVLALFSSGEEGPLYDFSQISTLFQDAAGTTPVTAVGQPVGRANDLSGNNNHATQSTATARPIWSRVPAGGRRNELIGADTFSEIATLAGASSSSAVDESVTISDFDAASSDMVVVETIPSDPSVTWTGAIEIKASGSDIGRQVYVRAKRGTAGAFAQGQTLVTLTGNWQRISATVTLAADNDDVRIALSSAVPGTAANSFEIRRPQLELGATATNYQKVVNEYDITESGVASVYYLKDDGVDDAITVAMPDLGTDATRAVVNLDGTVTYLENQTIGAGNIDVPLDKSAVLYIDRDLTANEKSDFEAWAS